MLALSLVLAESNWIAPLTFAAGVGLLTWLMLRKTFKRLGKRSRSGSGPYLKKQRRPASTWDGTKQDANARFDRQQVELHELARDLNGQIDSKLILFRELVAKSEQQVARLEELLEQAESRTT